MKKLSFILLFCAGLMLLLPSCSKDELTKPTKVALQMELGSQEHDIGARMDAGGRFTKKNNIRIEGIQYRISGIEFEGYRENGENYFFSREFEEEMVIDVKAGGSSPILDFDMPQGLYERISIALQVKTTSPPGSSTPYNEEAAIIMRGNYMTPQDIAIPFIFVYDFDEVFNHAAKNAGGASEIAVKQSQATIASVSFDMPYWFQLINPRMLQSASLSLVDGQLSIIISENNNEHIFDLLSSRIKNVKQLTFR